jgi:hypothetical protein
MFSLSDPTRWIIWAKESEEIAGLRYETLPCIPEYRKKYKRIGMAKI